MTIEKFYHWFENPKPYDDYVGMQIFRTTWRRGNFNKKDKLKEHKYKILKHAIYSNLMGYKEGGSYSDTPVETARTMKGFIAQKCRKPKKKDKVRFVFLAGNGISRWLEYIEFDDIYENANGDKIVVERAMYLSECKIEIL